MITKNDFYHILIQYTPTELNEFISSKGKQKIVNGITFVENEQECNVEIQKK